MALDTSIVVSDAGPIIHLDELGKLHYLFSFSKIIIPSLVKKEIEKYRTIDYTNFTILDDPEISKDMEILYDRYELHEGEIFAISIARQIENCILLTDDSAARLTAFHLKINVHGTIGILLRSVRLGMETPENMIQILKLIPEKIIREFKERIINIHPALLPKYGGKGMFGMKVHQAVYDAKEKETGITIHHVNEKFDEGEIIFQEKFSLGENDSAEKILEKIRKSELEFYPKVIEDLLMERG